MKKSNFFSIKYRVKLARYFFLSLVCGIKSQNIYAMLSLVDAILSVPGVTGLDPVQKLNIEAGAKLIESIESKLSEGKEAPVKLTKAQKKAVVNAANGILSAAFFQDSLIEKKKKEVDLTKMF